MAGLLAMFRASLLVSPVLNVWRPMSLPNRLRQLELSTPTATVGVINGESENRFLLYSEGETLILRQHCWGVRFLIPCERGLTVG